MKLLLANDDGVYAPGLHILAEVLSKVADIKVVAPDRDHSGASNSLTLNRPLKPVLTSNGFYSVDGTPTDCVHLGVTNLFDVVFDRVVSGINTHANLGDDVLYSGTVAAATEGRFLEQCPIAVSLANTGGHHYSTAAQVVLKLLLKSDKLTLPPRTILNVNVPDMPLDEIRGVKITRLGHRARGGLPERTVDPRGQERFWIGSAGEGDDAGPDTDFWAVANGFVSITPISVDMTRYDVVDALNAWVPGGEL
ncbi:MAG: 5'/3'-nucleotidase SurE [Pseudomonadales bacterium]|uniref:5'-nucleotidase SurE n=1 Tax=Oleiphilus messinensis TaxID=141451 RepID=A0A1Y0IAX3_9GAMM|nr:5'/3'-nucleotidase SurE [Oleiphilus messinensis]ARU57667.1 stationary phase survival protein SurE [Oleiphilus messinensis]MCG8613096.1 5'/3'-nucleotidase SurE [Pseudomonadales bacterium]